MEAESPVSVSHVATVDNAKVMLMAYICASIAIYFLPTIVAFSRQHHNSAAIMALNLFLGCTVVGWVVALCWALTQVKGPSHHYVYIDPKTASLS
jgi:Superinfection immunity protein